MSISRKSIYRDILRCLGIILLSVLLISASSCGGGGGGEGEVVPSVTTLPTDTDIDLLTPHVAIVQGIVNPNGVQTEAWFEWGSDPSLTNPDVTQPQDMGSVTYDINISAQLSGLDPETPYYFRIVARTVPGGTEVRGSIEKFTSMVIYVAFGDSITYGKYDNYPADNNSVDGRNTGGGFEPVLNDLLSTEYPHSVITEGFEGHRASQGLDDLPGVLSRNQDATYYLILFGTNDAFSSHQTPSGWRLLPGDPGYTGSYKDSMQRIIDQVYAAGKIPYLAKVPKTLNSLYLDSLIWEYNQVVDELKAINDISVVPPDLYNGLTHPGDFAVDKLHPNGEGYKKIAALWLDSLVPP